VRLNTGDTVSTPIVPPNPDGTNADYLYFSDAEINSYLTQGGSNPMMATGFAYLALARNAAMQQGVIKTDDLNVDDTSRAAALRLLADEWFNRANNVEWFVLTPTGDAEVDVRDYFYPNGLQIPSEYLYSEPASELFPASTS
jgi:hypothetical protein